MKIIHRQVSWLTIFSISSLLVAGVMVGLIAHVYAATSVVSISKKPKVVAKVSVTPTPKPTPTPTPTPKAVATAASTSATSVVATGGGVLPSRVLNLTNWKITLPTDGKGGTTAGGQSCLAQEIKQPALASLNLAPWFTTTPAGDGVVFRANIEGCTTSGSAYPRSELREMTNNGSSEASWSTTVGTSTMQLTEAVTHLPVRKPQTTFAQVHDASDDVFEAEAIGQANGTAKLVIVHDGTVWGQDLDDAYTLGTRFTLRIVASGGFIDVYYNGAQKVHQPLVSSGDYFKAGNYTQSNIAKGQDAPGAYGEVVLYSLDVSHS